MNRTIKILLAEDEPSLGQIIKESLETRNFEVILCVDGNEAYEKYLMESPELLVLDVMMPKRDGFSLAKDIRKENPTIPIIFLTSKSQTKDVIEGFKHGGDDYLKKPFSMEELIVRINVLLKRIFFKKESEHIKLGNYIFKYKKQALVFEENTQSLTHREAELLYYLCENRNETLNRTFILKKLWGDDDFFNARSMDVFITKLRKKLNKDEQIKIVNVRGYGYKLIC